jgi:hypothetical protein
MSDATFTFRVDDALKAEFSTAAKTCDTGSGKRVVPLFSISR